MGIDLKAIDRAITKTENFIVETANKEIRKVAVKVSSSLILPDEQEVIGMRQ